MGLADPAPWLLLVAAAHLGFQLTVDLVVYPALGEVPGGVWAVAHDRHSRRIVPLVALLYPPLVLLLGWACVAEPRSPATWVAIAGGLLAVAHHRGRGGAHPRSAVVGDRARSGPALMRRLDRADRVRSVGAVVVRHRRPVACVAGALSALGPRTGTSRPTVPPIAGKSALGTSRR